MGYLLVDQLEKRVKIHSRDTCKGQEAGKMKIEGERKKAGLVWVAAAEVNCNII